MSFEYACASHKLKSGWMVVLTRGFCRILEQVLPADEPADGTLHKDRRSRQYVDRPSFSLPLMSTNFRRFNSRYGGAHAQMSTISSDKQLAGLV